MSDNKLFEAVLLFFSHMFYGVYFKEN